MAGTEPRFILDVNVGRLAKWLRAMGYDTLFIPGADDGELVRRALSEERILVTRDAYMMQRRIIATGRLQAVLVREDDVMGQLRQLIGELGLHPSGLFSRCIRCNEPMTPVGKEAVVGRVPPYVLRTQEEFMECTSCGRVYWKGTHWHNMRRELARVGGGNG